jgi:hypothetical protein
VDETEDDGDDDEVDLFIDIRCHCRHCWNNSRSDRFLFIGVAVAACRFLITCRFVNSFETESSAPE